jgi:threonine dehydrogenase-like Zn-dependent dehydrogenase
MRALTVLAGKADTLEVADVPEPEPGPGALLVQGLSVGVCGTDREIAAAEYGQAPPGRDRLVLGHESLGRVLEAPQGSGFAPGDLVAGIVRRPDPEPCGACARGEFDMCRNGLYTERGIMRLDGYASQRWAVEAEYAVHVDERLAQVGMLMEPASILAKAWEQIERIAARAWWEPARVLVTGAGPIGLLAALMAVQRGLETHVIDLAETGVKPRLVADLGAAYHTGTVAQVTAGAMPDIVIEATGAPSLIFEAVRHNAKAGIVCLTGVSPAGHRLTVDAGALGRDLVLENDVVFGSVNANHRHYRAAAASLAAADPAWLARMITRRVPLERAREAFEPHPDDVKVVIDL